MLDKRFKQFYFFLFFTAFLPYLPYVFPFLPDQVFGFNWTGWAWIIMLSVTIINLTRTRKIAFPIGTWAPWMLYLIVYIIIDFSFIGLQLTLQYLLPLLIGIVASGFSYSDVQLKWLFKWFSRLCGVIVIFFIVGHLIMGNFSPAAAATPMILSIGASLMTGIYYMTKEKKHLLYFGLLFMVPVIDVTRMGIAAFLAIFIFHFANHKTSSKLIYGLLGLILVVIVFNSKGFQEKTFYGEKGSLSDLSLNYTNNENINNSGRGTLYKALEYGLKTSPTWGNGPRADRSVLLKSTDNQLTEAHSDYQSVRYNYGYMGLGLLLFGFAANFLALWRLLPTLPNTWSVLVATSTLTLFIVFVMFMYSDNILKYTVFFPDFFFAMIGIVFGIYKNGWSRELPGTQL